MLSRRGLLWLVPLFITLHNLEELWGIPRMLPQVEARLPAWVANSLPPGIFPPTARQFVWMLLVVTVLPYLFALLGGARAPRGPRTFLLAGTQMVMFINVASHLVMAGIAGGYVPGLATALAFNLPFSLVFFGTGMREGWLRWDDLGILLLLALVAHGPGMLGLVWFSRLLSYRLTAFAC